MLPFSKDEIVEAGLCEACASKFVAELERLCWDCMYAEYARAAAHRRPVAITASPAWKSPQKEK